MGTYKRIFQFKIISSPDTKLRDVKKKMRYSAFKNFFNKQYYDFDRADINLYDFHPQLLVFAASFGIFYRNRDSLVRFVKEQLIKSS